ncbi:SUMF1/EgtB/PvdO family nonheme iron enzyme [candidate division KSB1 bacterium]|nr:SUMF1/EgtB/PvdO family nonheme iron enzyme [candidate division KSB1 bacterium]
MSIPIAAVFLKIFDFGAGILSDLIASKAWDKFNDDLERVIFKLIKEQNQEFKQLFPEAALDLKESEVHQIITDHFGDLTAHQFETPLEKEELAQLFAQLFLKPQFRESDKFEDIDPKYRKRINECATDFIDSFKRKAEAAFIRNSAAATTILLNSLAQSGKNDDEIIHLLQTIYTERERIPELLGDIVQIQLLPAIKNHIQDEFNRFREDWKFILRTMRFETTKEEELQKEWLEQLAQILEWKGFSILHRSSETEIPGEIYRMEKADEFGQAETWICWGCPTETCPEESIILKAIYLMDKSKCEKRFVISKSPLKETVLQYLDDHNIKTHLTLDSFVQTILNISKHRENVMGDYERRPICHQFIDLQCSRSQDKKPLDLKDYFYHWLGSEGNNHISLLGDFGTGKTEFCRRMQWELLKEYLPNNTNRIPVVITLREQKGLKLPQMIDSIMNTMGLKQIDYAAFRTLNRMGLFAIFIDGFDEMATHASLDEMVENFREMTVLAEGKAKVFLTCRTHYFEHAAREKEVMALPEFIAERSEFQIMYLNPFTRDQIEAYLDRVKDLRKPKRDVLAEMDKHPTLQELMQTPVLLDMILKIFPELMEAEEEITLSLVYKKATERWISDEKRKGHLKKLSPKDVLQFMEDLAWQMHIEDTLAINYKKLKSQTYNSFRAQMEVDSYELDAFYGEIRTCTFLTRDSMGDYKFAHKSFMEYFTACYLQSKLLADKAPEVPINEEIRQFLHYLILPQADYKNHPRFKFTGELLAGMKRCGEHDNCFIHLKDNSHMVWIPPGQFIAGGEYNDNEKPTRIGNLEKGAFLDKYPVTNAQYAHFLNEIGKLDNKWIDLQGSFKNEKSRILNKKGEFIVEQDYERHPVNFVSFYGAEAYAKWVGKELPSEWLWEKAGRGIDGRTYPWGDEWDWDKCNSGEHWAKRDLSDSDVWNKWYDSDERLKAIITQVDYFVQFQSPSRCLDLSGNLWEWMKELWTKDENWRVVRGGAFSNVRNDVRLAVRSFDLPDYHDFNVGFRLSRTS